MKLSMVKKFGVRVFIFSGFDANGWIAELSFCLNKKSTVYVHIGPTQGSLTADPGIL